MPRTRAAPSACTGCGARPPRSGVCSPRRGGGERRGRRRDGDAGVGRASRGVPYASLFAAAGRRHGVDPALLAAVAKTESGFDPAAVSPAGAKGLMQLMPSTAASLGVDPLDPAQAVDGSARLLRQLLDRFGGRVDLALAGYNAGPGAIQRYGGVPPYRRDPYVRPARDDLMGGPPVTLSPVLSAVPAQPGTTPEGSAAPTGGPLFGAALAAMAGPVPGCRAPSGASAGSSARSGGLARRFECRTRGPGGSADGASTRTRRRAGRFPRRPRRRPPTSRCSPSSPGFPARGAGRDDDAGPAGHAALRDTAGDAGPGVTGAVTGTCLDGGAVRRRAACRSHAGCGDAAADRARRGHAAGGPDHDTGRGPARRPRRPGRPDRAGRPADQRERGGGIRLAVGTRDGVDGERPGVIGRVVDRPRRGLAPGGRQVPRRSRRPGGIRHTRHHPTRPGGARHGTRREPGTASQVRPGRANGGATRRGHHADPSSAPSGGHRAGAGPGSTRVRRHRRRPVPVRHLTCPRAPDRSPTRRLSPTRRPARRSPAPRHRRPPALPQPPLTGRLLR